MATSGPKPPTSLGRLFVRYVVGFSVGVAVGVSPFLGRASVPGFDALLSLFPISLQNTTIPLAGFMMGIIAISIQFYYEERPPTTSIRVMFRRTITIILAAGVLLVITYIFATVTVPIKRGTARESFVTGIYRLSQCPCGTLSDRECIEQISLNEAAIAACWGDGQVRVFTLLLTIQYLILTGGFAVLIGLLILRERPLASSSRSRTMRPRGSIPKSPRN